MVHLDAQNSCHRNQLGLDLEENGFYYRIQEISAEAPIVSATVKSLSRQKDYGIDNDSDCTCKKPDKGLMIYKRRYVQHEYHDHSRDEPPPKEEGMGCSNSSNGKMKARKHRDSATLFPLRLHKLLSMVETEGLSSIISWQVHGRAFKMHKPKEFVEKLMPIHFHQTKMASFRRQLNLYGFLRITQGRDKGAYYHEFFLRGMNFLSSKCIRQRVKGTMVKAVSNPGTEPDFYSMPFLGSVDRSSKENVSLSESYTSASESTALSSPNCTVPAVIRPDSYNISLQPSKVILNMEEKSIIEESSRCLDYQWETLATEKWDLDTFSVDYDMLNDMMF